MSLDRQQRRRARGAWGRAGAALVAVAAVGAMGVLGSIAGCGGHPGSGAGAAASGDEQEQEDAAGGTAAGAEKPGRAGRPIDACQLLTPEDVQAVTGEVAGSLSSTLEDAVGRDPNQCAYPLAANGQPRVVSLLVRRLGGPGQAAAQQEATRAGMGSIAAGAAVEDVRGLGDAAFWVGGQLDQMHVQRGAAILVFTVQIDRDPERAAHLLAERALARLALPAGAPATPLAPGAAPAAPGGAQP